MTRYADVLEQCRRAPEAFWLQAASCLDWYRSPSRALDASNPPFYRWFGDGELNVCHNALDRHVEAGHGDRTALVYDSPVTSTIQSFSYAELRDATAAFAGALVALGVGPGDRVVIYMPMVPEAVVAMLACARIGAVHSVVFGGFAAHELAARIDDAQPVVVVSASCGIERAKVIEYKPLLDQALTIATHRPTAQVILQRPQASAPMGVADIDWHEAIAAGTPAAPARIVPPTRSTSSTPPERPGVPRVSCATPAAMLWRWHGL